MRNGHKIGRYHAIVKKMYADGSHDYETDFCSRADLLETVAALNRCVGKTVGIATDTPRVLAGYQVIRGRDAINREIYGK